MLNFRRNGTAASVGVSQMTMPSRYRSSRRGAAAADPGCTDVLAGASCGTAGVGSETATVPSGRVEAGCAETAAANDVSDVNATATAALRNARGIDTSCRSAENDGLGEASFAGFLVLAVHVSGGLGQSHDGGVEIDAVPGGDFIAGDRICGPRLDRPERTALDARHLHVTRDRIAGHAEVVLQRRFGRILDHVRVGV